MKFKVGDVVRIISKNRVGTIKTISPEIQKKSLALVIGDNLWELAFTNDLVKLTVSNKEWAEMWDKVSKK